MATIIKNAMTLEEFGAWLMGRREKARLYLADLGYQTRDKRQVTVNGDGEPGYYLRKNWIRLRRGDVVQLKNGDVEII